MPRFHKYLNSENCYVRTSIRGAVIMFQLTPEGQRKLKEADVALEQNFPRGLLLDLCRTGDAYTGGSGVSEPIPDSLNQLELDFPQDPDPETAFPSCDDCGSLENLHLSVVREQGTLAAKLQCSHCRDVKSHLLYTCIPVRLMNLGLFGRLFEIKPVTKKHEGVNRFDNLLRSEVESKWEELRKLRGSSQRGLFETGLGGELSLSGSQKKL